MSTKTKTYNFPECTIDETFEGVEFQLIVNGVPKNLTGAIINMIITAGDVIIFSTTSGELVVTDAINARFTVKKQIITLPVGTNSYRMKFIFPNGDVKTYIKGTWPILQ